jgi:hypothetical protein
MKPRIADWGLRVAALLAAAVVVQAQPGPGPHPYDAALLKALRWRSIGPYRCVSCTSAGARPLPDA